MTLAKTHFAEDKQNKWRGVYVCKQTIVFLATPERPTGFNFLRPDSLAVLNEGGFYNNSSLSFRSYIVLKHRSYKTTKR